MPRIAIIGSSGMIGSGVARKLANTGLKCTELNRSGIAVSAKNKISFFNIDRHDLKPAMESLLEFDYVINLAGIIRHKIDDSNVNSVENALYVNGVFPGILDRFGADNDVRVIQIGTDCVYSGDRGSYSESDLFDPIDIYGHSKVFGEISLINTMNLRVSVVGHEETGHVELMDWVQCQPAGSSINGFINHFWSGVTPLQIAKIIQGIINNGTFTSGTQHLVPANKVSKFQLVEFMAARVPERAIEVLEYEASKRVDRSLITLHPERNKALWADAGYKDVPSIQDMIAEYMEWSNSNYSS